MARNPVRIDHASSAGTLERLSVVAVRSPPKGSGRPPVVVRAERVRASVDLFHRSTEAAAEAARDFELIFGKDAPLA